MRRCTCSERRRPSACTTFARCSSLSEPFPLADCDLSLVLPSLIRAFYSLPDTRVPVPLCSGRALAGEQVGRPRRRRAFRAAHLVRVAVREPPEELAVAGLAQLLAHGPDRGLDHRVAVAPAHQVRAHLIEVLAG